MTLVEESMALRNALANTPKTTAPLAVGTLVYRLGHPMGANGSPMEIATIVGHTSDLGDGLAGRAFYEDNYGVGWMYRLRRQGGKGKGGQVHWHESDLVLESEYYV